MLIALLILGGAIVVILLGLWLSAQALARPSAVPVTLVPRGDGAGISDTEQYDPNVAEPGMDFDRDEPSFLDTMETVVDIVSQRSAVFSDISPMSDELLTPGGKLGDGRTRGEGIGVAGRVRRWEFSFGKGMTTADYATMLDFFGIELGVLQPGGKILYVSRLSENRPRIREGVSAGEQRYYLTWLKGDTENADRELLDKAGVEHRGRLVIKFLPKALEADLEAQERDFAKEREPNIKVSFYRLTREGAAYRFQLYNQLY